MSSVWGKLRGASEHLRIRGDHDSSEDDTAILRALEKYYSGADPAWLSASQRGEVSAQESQAASPPAHPSQENTQRRPTPTPLDTNIPNSTSLQDILQRTNGASSPAQSDSPLHRPERTRSGLATRLKRANW